MEQITAQIDTKILQEAADKAAMEGAIKTIEEFYKGYNSPFRKGIEEALKNKGLHYSFELPDIIAEINKGLSTEIDKIANAAIAESYLPMVQKFLLRAEPAINFSDILRQFIEYSSYEENEDLETDEFKVYGKQEEHFKYVTISDGENEYRIGFTKTRMDGGEWCIFSLPTITNHSYAKTQVMELSSGDMVLKVPFTPNILSNPFVSYLARMVISKTVVKFDVEDFREDMFPERHQCHC